MVPAVQGAEVDLEQIPNGDLPFGRPMVRHGAVRTGCDDRLEGEAVGTELIHAVLEIASDVFLGASDQPADSPQFFQRPAGDRTRLAKERDLVLVLDRSECLDRASQVHELGPFCRLLDRLGDGERDVVLLDAEPECAVGSRPSGQCRRDVALLEKLQVGCGRLRRSGVPAIGGEDGFAVGLQQQRGVAACQAGEIPHVDQPRDQRGVGAHVGNCTRKPRAPRRMLSRHGLTLLTARTSHRG